MLFDLYRYIRSGIVKHLWVYDQSRLSRNDQVASVFRYECDKQGVTLYTKDGQFDLSSASDSLLKQMLDAVAQFDNKTRTERTRLGKLNRVRSGSWHGGPPPFGYKLENKKLVINNEEASWLQVVFNKSLAGAAPSELKVFLDSNGVKPRRGGLWTMGSIAAMLRNGHYSGKYTYTDNKTGEVISVPCPSIVEMDIWEGVQVAHKREGNRHQQKNRTTKNFYLLRDILYCGHCSRPISGRVNVNRYEALYYCPNKERKWVEQGGSAEPWKRGTGCGFERSMNIHRADEVVWKCVSDLHQKSSTLKEAVKSRLMAQQGLTLVTSVSARRKAEARARSLQKQLQAHSETLGNLQGTRLLKQGDDTVLKATAKTVQDEIDRLEGALNDVRLQLRGESERQKWVNWLDAFGEELEKTREFTDDERQKYIAGLVERIDVLFLPKTSEHQLTLHFKLPIVGDGVRWLGKSKKSGYKVVDGERTTTINVVKKGEDDAQ